MRRLKIVEQIIIVLVFAVLIPFVTMGLIINNVSQQSIRQELAYNASLIAKFTGNAIENYVAFSQAQLNQMASGFSYIPDTMEKLQYFDEMEAKSKLFKTLDVVKRPSVPSYELDIKNSKLRLYAPIEDKKNYYLTGQIEANIINALFSEKSQRHIYIFNSEDNKLIATNADEKSANLILSELTSKEILKEGIFGKRKNTPKAYYKIDNPNWVIVVDTTQKITSKTIVKARGRILLSLCLSALFIFIIVGLYTTYLYINVRQLFKGITAISKGNYDKKIHLLKTVFTPYEIVFLAKEFNYMANKINVSYKDLRRKNIELEELNKFREHLVSATSHEFRTPLTSIIGYTSRLLRRDVVVDDEMKLQSLQIIKQQAQRLSKMVEDLLVIPELESIEFETDFSKDTNYVYSDPYRLEQILVNIIDNAIKYNIDNQPIKIEIKNVNQIPTLKISNKCEKISEKMKEKLFDKFIRVDSELTRTTRGTGLGLYIVKGLANAMEINLKLDIDDYFTMTLEFSDYVK